MASTLADFTLSAVAAPDDFIVGYDEAALNGERRWTVSTISKAVSGIITPEIINNISITGLSGVEIVAFTEKKATPSISSNVLTLDLSTAGLFYVNLNSNITTLTLTNVPTSPKVLSFTVQFVADGTLRAVSWPLGTRWANGILPTLTSVLNKVDTFTFLTHDGGTNWFAYISDQNQ
jgi:hypothetical protein